MKIINFVRGSRNYIHSTDMIDILPLESEPEQFSLFLRAPSRHPGFWARSGTNPSDDQRYERTASLTLKYPSYRERWDFLVDKEADFDERLPDFEDNAVVYDIDYDADPPSCKVRWDNNVSVWVAAIAAMRKVGKELYPEEAGWYIAYVHSNLNYLDPSLIGGEITMRLGKKREFLEIEYDIAGKPSGRIGFIQR